MLKYLFAAIALFSFPAAATTLTSGEYAALADCRASQLEFGHADSIRYPAGFEKCSYLVPRLRARQAEEEKKKKVTFKRDLKGELDRFCRESKECGQ